MNRQNQLNIKITVDQLLCLGEPHSLKKLLIYYLFLTPFF